MTKIYIALVSILTVLSSLNAIAATSKLPAKLICQPVTASKDVQSFEIQKMNTENPTSTIPDTKLLDFNVDSKQGLVTLGFSNECDNSYVLVFFLDDLVKLSSAKTKTAKALLNYSDASLESEANDPAQAKTIAIECIAK